MLYRTAWLGLGVLWTALAVACFRRRGRGRVWSACAVLALLLASLRLLRWNWRLNAVVGRLLVESGRYEERGKLKLALGIALGVVLAASVALLGRRFLALDPGARLALGALLAMAAFELVNTLSLDFVFPRLVLEQPGRYLLEYAVLGLAAAGALRREPVR